MKKLLLIALLVCIKQVNGQVTNDNCSNAINLGTLGEPVPCATGIVYGSADTLTATTIGATPDSPYTIQGPCAAGTMATPANDVWYSFTMPADGYNVQIIISNAGFTPNVALWQGSCSSLVGMGCTVGSTGTVTFTANGLTTGQTYLIQLSGNTSQSGNFKMSVRAFQNCSGCVVGATYSVTPLPVNNMYGANQTVTFCYHITDWSQVNTNWLHGIQVSFGSGWNIATLTTSPSPSCDGDGTWAYYPGGETSSATGTIWPAGFYYNSDLGGCSCVDTNPGDNFGDDCSGTIAANAWVFCVTITTNSILNSGSDLNVTFGTSADGESGGWTNNGCAADFPTVIYLLPDTTNNTTSINKLKNGSNSVNIYPNPNNGSFVIEPQNTLYNVHCTLYDVNGKVVLTQTINGKTNIDASSLNEGVYNISLQSNEGVVNKRLVIVR